MRAILVMVGISLGGWVGWALGARLGIFGAYILSVIGSALGLYFTRRLITRYL